jgi:hypothetical protein
MNQRFVEKYSIFFGVLLGVLYLFRILTVPPISLDVLSIFFGGLLAIYLIIPCVQNFKQFEYIKKSGHIKDLLSYISYPLWISLILIIMDLLRKSIDVKLNFYIIESFNFLYMSLWGVFILSLVRIIILLPKILINQTKK